MIPLQWTTSPSGALTARAFGFEYEVSGLLPFMFAKCFFGLKFNFGRKIHSVEEGQELCQSHSDAVASAIDVAMAGSWISVKERLPDENRFVLLACHNSASLYYVQTGRMLQNEDRSYTWKCCDFPEEVTHWQPLPQPPTKETK